MRNKILLGLLFASLFSSCTRYYYMPNAQNVPLFREKNEFRFTLAGGGINQEAKSTEVQAAYSLTDNLAVNAGFMGVKGGSSTQDTANNWGTGSYLEGALGYFQPVGDNSVFEVFGGFGSGNQHHQFGNSSRNYGTADLSFSKVFVQPAFGYTHDLFDVALSMRFSSVSFHGIDRQIDSSISNYNEVRDIENNRHSLLLEPALTIRGGWKYTKLQLQFVLSQNLSRPNLSFQKANVSLGLFISLAKRYKE